MGQLLFNNLLVAADGFGLPLPNRGLAFGDGFFETLIFTQGQLRLAADHFARMQQAAAALYLTLPTELASPEALETTLARLAGANHLAARLRLQLWRAGGGLLHAGQVASSVAQAASSENQGFKKAVAEGQATVG